MPNSLAPGAGQGRQQAWTYTARRNVTTANPQWNNTLRDKHPSAFRMRCEAIMQHDHPIPSSLYSVLDHAQKRWKRREHHSLTIFALCGHVFKAAFQQRASNSAGATGAPAGINTSTSSSRASPLAAAASSTSSSAAAGSASCLLNAARHSGHFRGSAR